MNTINIIIIILLCERVMLCIRGRGTKTTVVLYVCVKILRLDYYWFMVSLVLVLGKLGMAYFMVVLWHGSFSYHIPHRKQIRHFIYSILFKMHTL